MSDQKHQETGPPPKPTETGEPGFYCRATTRDGSPCSNRAGFKTDHVGRGRCYLHGGGAQNVDAGNFKHGLYSKLDQDLGERISRLRKNPALTDMKEQIAAQAALIERFLGELEDRGELDADTVKTVVRLHDYLSRNIHRMHKVEGDEALNPREAQILIQQVVTVVRETAGPETAEEVGRRLLEVDDVEGLEPAE